MATMPQSLTKLREKLKIGATFARHARYAAAAVIAARHASLRAIRR